MSIEPSTIERELMYGLENDYSKSEDDTLDELISNAKLDLNEELAEECSILKINGNSYGTLGNISTFIGKAKSKKSMLVAIFCAVLTGEKDIPGLEPGLKNCRGVILDTEQSKRHCQIQYKRVEALNSNNLSANLDYYFLRPHSPIKRLKMINRIINKTESLKFVVIDGIADLLSKGVNDEEEAIALTNQLMKWSSERNIHIISILHQNKGNENAKGHIGSLLVQKSETVLSIKRDTTNPDISIINTPFSRGLELEEFYLSVHEKTGIPYILENFDEKKKTKKSKNPFDYELETHYQILSEIYQDRTQVSYGELRKLIKSTCKNNQIDFGEKKSRDWLRYYLEQQLIYQKEPSKPYLFNKPGH